MNKENSIKERKDVACSEARTELLQSTGSDFDWFLTIEFYPMMWDFNSQFGWWQSKTNSVLSQKSLFCYLAYLPQIRTIHRKGVLSLSQLENHYYRFLQGLRNHANDSRLAELVKLLETDSFLFPPEVFEGVLDQDIDILSARIAQDMFRQYDQDRKVRIPFRPSIDDPEMGFCEYPVFQQTSEPIREPSGNKSLVCAVDVYRVSSEEFGSFYLLSERREETPSQ